MDVNVLHVLALVCGRLKDVLYTALETSPLRPHEVL